MSVSRHAASFSVGDQVGWAARESLVPAHSWVAVGDQDAAAIDMYVDPSRNIGAMDPYRREQNL